MIDNSNSLWTEKYRPKSLNDYYISKQHLELVKDWIKALRDNEPDAKPFLILYGTAGIGKTTLAHLILQKFGYEIIECNASDTRSKKQIKESIGTVSRVSVCIDNKNNFKPTAIIMDEIDGLNGVNENSGVQELVDIIVSKDKNTKETKWICPVVCTTNNIKEKKLQNLLKYGILLNLKKPNCNDALKLIDKILKEEGFEITNAEKDNIIMNANGDYRQIIMLLHQNYLNRCNNLNNQNQGNYVDSNYVDSNKLIIQEGKIDKDSRESIPGGESILDGENNRLMREINNCGDTPLDKINYFLTNKINLDIVRYFCSGDSNLFFMNFYNNSIGIISNIQEKKINTNTKSKDVKEGMLKDYKLLNKVYNSIRDADLLNNAIFLDKKWELLDYFDIFSVGIPCITLYKNNLQNKNILPEQKLDMNKPLEKKKELIVKDFNLGHHTQYNYMRQEQALNRKKIIVDYMKTNENDYSNIYYNLKRFQNINCNMIKKSNSNKNTKRKNLDNEDGKYIIDKSYMKILDKINELLN